MEPETPHDATNRNDTRGGTTPLSTPETAPPADTFTPPSPGFTTNKPKKRKTLLIVIVVLIAVVLALIGGVASAYAFWWNQPDKVVSDAFGKAVTAEHSTARGTITFTPTEGEAEFTLDFDSRIQDRDTAEAGLTLRADLGFFREDISGTVVADGDKTLLKLNDLAKTLDTLEIPAIDAYRDVIAQIDGKWVDLTTSATAGGPDEEAACYQQALQLISGEQLKRLYDTHTFFVLRENRGVEDINGRASNHYLFELDEQRIQAFGEAFEQTEWFKKLDSCASEDADDSDTEQTPDTPLDRTVTAEIWVDRWFHQPTKTLFTIQDSEAKLTIESTMDLRARPTITVPQADVTLEELQRDIEEATEQYLRDAGSGLDITGEAEVTIENEQDFGVGYDMLEPRVQGAQTNPFDLGWLRM